MERKFIEKIIEKNGIPRQCIVAMEECSELQKAISKMLRYHTGDKFVLYEPKANLIEEMADVIICIQQLQVMYDISTQEIMDAQKVKEKRTLTRNKII